ncbi:MAG: phosphoribosylamine--glycine ligase, partial [Cellvibrionaceae bacterium]|nr:phosphoribosylamine--glycine ligase [Cellvibrionaceae bacterium]
SGLGLGESEAAKVFHAGTALDGEQVVTAGGRVLCATALGNSVSEAQAGAYKLAEKISWQGSFYRSDIGYRAIAREQ